MAWRCGSLSRSLLSTARAASLGSSPSLPRLRSTPLSHQRLQLRRRSFANPRSMGEIGCSQSHLPLHSFVRLTSHLSVDARACCELFQEIGIGIDREEWKRWMMHQAVDHHKTRRIMYLYRLLDQHRECYNVQG